jgi:hypothetical protein
MKKNSQSSIWNNLIRIMPDFKNQIGNKSSYVDPFVAKSLYNLWKSGEQKKDNIYKKPVTLGHDEVKKMRDAGLVKPIGENIQITSKGSDIINVMILGDDRSIFEDDGKTIDYSAALNNTKNVKTAKKLKVASSWWGRFNNNE